MTTYYAAVDTETTGLYSNGDDVLLQVAAFVTTMNYEPLDEGVEFVIKFTPNEVETLRNNAVPFVQQMHDTTGLWGRLSSPEALTYAEADKRLSEYFAQFDAEALYMLGNSITLDRNFLEKFLPKSFAMLHYRSLDVTSVRLFMENALGVERTQYRSADTVIAHEAKDDILAALAQIRFYGSLLWSPSTA